MMRKKIGILLALLALGDSFGQNQKGFRELFVINLLGAKVYEKPNFNSKVLTRLQVGEMIMVENLNSNIDSLINGKGFS